MTEVTTDVSCSANCSDSDSYDTYFWQEKGSHILMTYVYPVVVFVGIIGNLITLAVLFSKKFRKSPSSLILGALTLTDTAFLLMAFHYWLLAAGFTSVDSDASCKADTYFIYFLYQASPAILVILTVERAISVFFPLKCKEICSRRRLLLSVISTITLLGLANLFTAFSAEMIEDDPMSYPYCGTDRRYVDFWDKYWTWVDLFLAIFLPFTLILVGNILIVTKLYASRRKLSAARTGEKRTSSVTVMLIAVSICFLVLNLPTIIFQIGYYVLKAWPTDTFEDRMQHIFFSHVMTVSSDVNYAINFLMYCLTGSKFRRAVKDLFTGCAYKCNCKMFSKTSESHTCTSNSVETTNNTAAASVASNETGISKNQL